MVVSAQFYENYEIITDKCTAYDATIVKVKSGYPF